MTDDTTNHITATHLTQATPHLSPGEISVLLHYYCHVGPFRECPLRDDAIKRFGEMGVLRVEIDDEGTGYRTTPKGDAWVALMCSTPCPEVIYRDPRTGNRINPFK